MDGGNPLFFKMALEESQCLQDAIDKLPDEMEKKPDIDERRNGIWEELPKAENVVVGV